MLWNLCNSKFKFIFSLKGVGGLFPYYLYAAVQTQLDDLAGFRLAGIVLAGLHDVVHALLYLVGNLGKASRRGLSADVCARAHDSFLEAVAKLVTDVLFRHAESHTPVLGNEVWGKTGSAIKDEGKRLFGKLHEVPSHIRHAAQVSLHPVGTVHQANHRLAVLAPFELEDSTYRLLVARIAPYAPYRVRRVQDEPALP